MDQKNISSTVKHGEGSVMVCGDRASSEVRRVVFIEGKIYYFQYINILKLYLAASVESLGLGNLWIFMNNTQF